MAEVINRGLGPTGATGAAGDSWADVAPSSVVCKTSGITSPDVLVGSSNSWNAQRFWLTGSPASSGLVDIEFDAPTVKPPGRTPYLRLLVEAAATTGTVNVNIAVGVTSVGGNVGTTTLTSLGDSAITWSSGQSGVLKELLVSLSGVTYSTTDLLLVRATFLNTTTLAVASRYKPSLTYRV